MCVRLFMCVCFASVCVYICASDFFPSYGGRLFKGRVSDVSKAEFGVALIAVTGGHNLHDDVYRWSRQTVCLDADECRTDDWQMLLLLLLFL